VLDGDPFWRMQAELNCPQTPTPDPSGSGVTRGLSQGGKT